MLVLIQTKVVARFKKVSPFMPLAEANICAHSLTHPLSWEYQLHYIESVLRHEKAKDWYDIFGMLYDPLLPHDGRKFLPQTQTSLITCTSSTGGDMLRSVSLLLTGKSK